MNEPPLELKKRLLYILHRGFVEARLLGGMGKTQQVLDLADAMELIPGMMKDWNDESLNQIKRLLKTYQDKYSVGRFEYLSRLDDEETLPF